jgi:hypothetical protein
MDIFKIVSDSTYKVTYSDIKGKPADHLPITAKIKFRSFKTAKSFAWKLHGQNRDVVIVESNSDGVVAIWEYVGGSDESNYITCIKKGRNT